MNTCKPEHAIHSVFRQLKLCAQWSVRPENLPPLSDLERFTIWLCTLSRSYLDEQFSNIAIKNFNHLRHLLDEKYFLKSIGFIFWVSINLHFTVLHLTFSWEASKKKKKTSQKMSSLVMGRNKTIKHPCETCALRDNICRSVTITPRCNLLQLSNKQAESQRILQI